MAMMGPSGAGKKPPWLAVVSGWSNQILVADLLGEKGCSIHGSKRDGVSGEVRG